MKGLLKLAFLTGLGAMAWRGWQERHAGKGADAGEDASPHPTTVVRDAGPQSDETDWDKVDEASDESFPASDPPGNF